MEFKVKPFAQLMILIPDVALIFDDITRGEFNIDSYELAEHPEIVQPNLVEAMNQAYDEAIVNGLYLSLYKQLYSANNDDIFWALLKEKNDYRRNIS